MTRMSNELKSTFDPVEGRKQLISSFEQLDPVND